VPFVHPLLGDRTVEHRPRQGVQNTRKQRNLDMHGITASEQNAGENL
jgi:hypothetical protein